MRCGRPNNVRPFVIDPGKCIQTGGKEKWGSQIQVRILTIFVTCTTRVSTCVTLELYKKKKTPGDSTDGGNSLGPLIKSQSFTTTKDSKACRDSCLLSNLAVIDLPKV